MTIPYDTKQVYPLPIDTPEYPSGREVFLLPERCPRCNDALVLVHSRGDHHARTHHFLGCQSFPRCSYTTEYDGRLLDLIERLGTRLVRCEAQIAWMTGEIEVLRGLVQEGAL